MDLVLDARSFRLLEGLRLNTRRAFAGRVRGERITNKKGVSIEFSDYRDYSEGDDLRHLDWNVLARLDSPVMRTYRDEEDLAVHLMLDASPSMDFGQISKFEYARQLALAIGYVGLCGGDAVQPRSVGVRSHVRILRGRAGYARLLDWASSIKPPQQSTERLSSTLRSFAASGARPGIVAICSDGLDPDISNSIKVLSGRRHEIWFLQVLSDIELDPDLEGDLRLLDGEGGSPREITANSSVLREYRARLKAHNRDLQEAATRSGGRYALFQPRPSIDVALKDTLKREGWLV